ncbi:MAG: TerB family tellurite resistance protein [Candidatus Cyclonatronum sp.]|uniref:tellurite resistance TerB family protein n=1 Tax=Cyclonatronum sp. TaxID=3024185 RepID=UPI0025C4640C|nr:hypothetical protein [Cyclonatronum sp.]MCH8487778.1 TerB family tellurite resistance protein [Cyclonatronum sp.]
MNNISLDKLFLKTAFSCMACDGHIDEREVSLIKTLHHQKKTFGEIDINKELEKLLLEINSDGRKFLRSYFNDLAASELSESEELKLVEVAIDTIKADDKVEYSEIKFFKVIKSKLKISDETILKYHPDFEEYLEQDIISQNYLDKLQSDYFETHKMIVFDSLPNVVINSDDSKKGT